MTTSTPVSLHGVFDRPVAPDGRPLLSLRGVSVHFGGIAALDGLDLDVEHHDLVAIIGPNGAGKTTTLNALCGIIPATGEVTFKGDDISRLSASRIARCGIGRSFQDPPLLEAETVIENVMCGAYMALRYRMVDQVVRRRYVRSEERRMFERAMTLLDFVGLAGQAEKQTGSLSFGARKLVDIVRAMMSAPQLLVLDEPSSGLDAQERDALATIFLQLRAEERVAILIVEHHMDLVRATARRVLALQAGKRLMFGTAEEVLDSDRFRTAIVGGADDDAPPRGEAADDAGPVSSSDPRPGKDPS